MKIASIVGARPQFVKLAPVDEELKKRGHEHVIIHTGQHYDYEMSKAFFEQLSIPEPDYNLEVGSGTHAYQTGQMLIRLGETLEVEQPDLVIVYGDTNSTLAGALAAVKLRIPSGHVEAGLRSFDFTMPEEINRIVADRICQLHFAPTATAVKNLKKEGIDEKLIFLTGNIMAETLLKNLNKARLSTILERLRLKPAEYAILTCHRQENTDDPARLTRIFAALKSSPVPVVFPAHPRTRKRIEEYLIFEKAGIKNEISLIDPLPYLDFINLEINSLFVLTDSGGVQEETLILNKPCITLRYNTERVESLEAGSNRLVGAEEELIKQAIEWAVREAEDKKIYPVPENWDIKVSERILTAIENIHELNNLLEVPEDFLINGSSW